MLGGDGMGCFNDHVSDIFYLSGKDGTWKKTFKNLVVPTSFHVALLVPDSFVEC